MQRRSEKYYNNCTQTEALGPELVALAELPQHTETKANSTTGTQTHSNAGAMRDHSTNTIGCPSPSVICQQHLQQHQHQQLHSAGSSSTSSTANSTPNTSRPNSKQSGTQRRSTIGSKLPISQSDSTLSLLSHGQSQGQGQVQGHSQAAKEESQLLSSVRSMRVDLAIKNKAMQRLTRELDDCKKTIRKLQRDRDGSASGLSAGKQNTSKACVLLVNNLTIVQYNRIYRYIPLSMSSLRSSLKQVLVQVFHGPLDYTLGL